MPAAAQAAPPYVTYDSSKSPAGLWIAPSDGTGAPSSFLANAYMSSWSADGSKVAFSTAQCRSHGGTGHIKVMHADGSGLIDLTSGCDPKISPDGSKIAFEGADTSETLYSINTTQGAIPVQLMDPNDGIGNGCHNYTTTAEVASCARPDDAAWLGNSTLVWEGALRGIWKMPAVVGGHPTEITGTDPSSGIVWLNGLAASYDGSTIAASGAPSSGNEGIFTLPAGGGTPSNTIPGISNHQYIFPQFSFDGTSITFEDYSNGTNTSSVATAPATGGTPTTVSGADITAANPAFAPPPAPPRTFTANPMTNVDEGASISFQGMNFNPSGSQIVVGYNNLVDPINKQTFSAQASFNGNATAKFGHPNADPNAACTAKLSATQDGKTDNVSITGVQQQVVVAQRGLARVENNQPIPLQPPEFACKGEAFAATSSPLDVLTIPVTDGYPFTPGFEANIAAFNFPGIQADANFVSVFGYRKGGQRLGGIVGLGRGATFCLPLNSGTPLTYGSLTAPAGFNGPYQGLGQIGGGCVSTQPHGIAAHNVSHFHNCNATGVQNVPAGVHDGDLTVNGPTCVKGSLEVNGDLLLGSAHFIVQGDLTINGSIRGTGALTVDGGTTVTGDFSGWSTDDNYLIQAGGDVHLQTGGTAIGTKAQIQNALQGQLAPTGKNAKIGMLLKHSGYKQKFASPSAGDLAISWYYVPKGAHIAKGKPKPVLVAKGSVRYTKPGTLTFKIKLTKAGRRLLKHRKHITLTAKGKFTPPGQKPIVVKKRFKLKR